MKNTIYSVSVLMYLVTLFISSCGITEKTESKSSKSKSTYRGDSTHQNTSSLTSTVTLSKYVYDQGHKEAGFELEFPKHKQRVEVGEVLYKFNTEKFPFVNGHSVRLAIEGGHEKHVYDSNKKVTLDSEGEFLSVAFLCDKHGVSLKGENTYVLSQLNVGVDTKKEIRLEQPMLFLTLPHSREGKHVLLDFFVKNVKLKFGGDRVLVSIDDDTEFYIHEWAPFQIKGLSKGKHKILVELVNGQGEVYDGPYTRDEREFDIQY